MKKKAVFLTVPVKPFIKTKSPDFIGFNIRISTPAAIFDKWLCNPKPIAMPTEPSTAIIDVVGIPIIVAAETNKII